MQFLRTQLGTDFREPSNWWNRLTSFGTANRSYRDKYHLIRCWLIEFDETGMPCREIGLDETGTVVVAGPSKIDYGFWLDMNMRYPDFPGDAVTSDYFEELWTASGVATSR